MNKNLYLLLITGFIILNFPIHFFSEDKSDHILRLLNKGIQYLNQIDNYQLILTRKEWLDQKNKYLTQKILYKFKKPFAVYLKIIAGTDKGVELIYKKGWNSNKVKVKIGKRTLNLYVNNSVLLKKNRHPIDESGLTNIINVIINDIKLAKRNNELKTEYKGQEMTAGKGCQVYALFFPKEKVKKGSQIKDQKANEYYAAKIVLWLDQKMGIPVKIQVWNEKLILVEDYVHSHFESNLLTEKDFNPQYYQFKETK